MIVYDKLGLYVQMGGRRMYPLYVWTWLPLLLVACMLLSCAYACGLLILVVSVLALDHDAFSVLLGLYVSELIMWHRIKVLVATVMCAVPGALAAGREWQRSWAAEGAVRGDIHLSSNARHSITT